MSKWQIRSTQLKYQSWSCSCLFFISCLSAININMNQGNVLAGLTDFYQPSDGLSCRIVIKNFLNGKILFLLWIVMEDCGWGGDLWMEMLARLVICHRPQTPTQDNILFSKENCKTSEYSHTFPGKQDNNSILQQKYVSTERKHF